VTYLRFVGDWAAINVSKLEVKKLADFLKGQLISHYVPWFWSLVQAFAFVFV
jgi:hypothetical protein